jgi:hypothetical protein
LTLLCRFGTVREGRYRANNHNEGVQQVDRQTKSDWALPAQEIFSIGFGFSPAMRHWLIHAANELCEKVCVGEATPRQPVGLVYAGNTTIQLPGVLVEEIERDFPNVHIGPLDMGNFFTSGSYVYYSFDENDQLRVYRRALEDLFQPHANSAITDYAGVMTVLLGRDLRDDGPQKIEIAETLTDNDITPTSMRFSTWNNSRCLWATKEWYTLQGQKVIRAFRI